MVYNSQLNHAMIQADTVYLDVVSVDGQAVPEEALQRAVTRLTAHTIGQFVIRPTVELRLPESAEGQVPRGRIAPPDAEGQLDRVALVFARNVEGGSRGVFMRMQDDWQQILFSSQRIQETASVFFLEDQVWEFVIYHELGHALGVPESAGHRWHAGHCTHPDCVMYPKIDARSITTFLIRQGPPMDFCRRCAAEIRAARESK